MQKRDLFWRHQDVLHPMAEYSSTPKGVLEYPWSTTRGTHSGETGETHGRQRDLEILHSAIRAPRSGRILMRRDPIFQLANTVVNEVRKRAFQPAIDLGLQAAEMRQARKKMARYAPFDIDDTSHGSYPPC